MNVPCIRPRIADVVFRLYTRPVHPEPLRRSLLPNRRTRWLLSVGPPDPHRSHPGLDRWPRSPLRVDGHRRHGTSGIRPTGSVTNSMAARTARAPSVRSAITSVRRLKCCNRSNSCISTRTWPRRRSPGNGLPLQNRQSTRSVAAGSGDCPGIAYGLRSSAFHTFPDELAIIKTQSLIEWE